MRRAGLVFYSFLYLLGLVLFALNFYTIKYSKIGTIIFFIGFFVFWIIGFFKQFSNKEFKAYISSPFKHILYDVKTKLSNGYRMYFYISSIIFIIIIIETILLTIFYGGSPEIIDGRYVITSHGNIIKDSISKYEVEVLTFFNNQIFICLSLLINSVIIINLKDKSKT